MKQRKIYILLGGMMAMLASSGCSREQLDNIVSSAAEVQFGASSMWQTEPDTDTRTEYSGTKVQVGTVWKERINWVKTTDRIRIYSPQAYKMYDSNTHIADYYISSDPDPRDEKSQAKIACVDKNGLQWSNSSDHHFYALYPAPETKWKYDQSVSVPDASAKIEASGTAGAKITGVIPTVQEVKYHDETSPTRKEYEPNMNYAYMYAVKRNVTRGSSVSLSFQPLVTTLQFTIKASDANAANLTLTGFKLKSSTVNLYGSFTATFNGSSDTPTISATGTGKEVSVSIPTGDRKKLSTNDLIMVTVFTLPVELTNLTIEMTFLNSSNQTVYRTLDLKSKSGSSTSWITVPACHKAYINSLGVPGAVWDYHLDVVNPTDLIAVGGTSTTARVTSYRQHTTTGAREIIGWTIQGYYSNAACTQKITRPSWITNITSSGSGTLPGSSESMTIAYGASPAGTPTTTSNSTLKNTTVLGSTSSYKNLSNPSNMDSNNIAESANCYIVNQPGYYKIPLVEGNGIIGNAKNKDKTTYLGASGTNQMQFQNWVTGAPAPDLVYLYEMGTAWGLYPKDAHVIWQDVSGLIDGMSITSDYKWLLFHVGGTTQGNALINVGYVGNDHYTMWQYHIWVTDFIPYNYPGYSSSTYGKDVTVTGSNSTTYDMMPLNLGWVGGNKTTTPYPERKVYAKLVQTGDGTATAVLEVKQAEMVTVTYSGGRAPYFQWGRKDAFWPSSSVSGQTWGTYFQQEGALQTNYWVTFRFRGNYGPTPHNKRFTFWLGTSANNWDWLGIDNVCNIWNASNNSKGAHTGAVRKTIYDPCPAGYCMPVQGAFSGFTSNRSNYNSKNTFGNWDAGWHIFTNASKRETIYFPSHGILANGGYVADGGSYWTADTNGTPGAYVFRFSNDNAETKFFYPDHSHARYFGCSVRPVRDTNKAN